MSGFSTSLANAVLNYSLNGVAMPAIRNRYFALFTADPTDAFSAGTEVSAPWYVRQLTGTYNVGSGTGYNITRAEFPAVTLSPVTVTHIGVVEGSSPTDVTSTLLYSHQLSAPVTLAVGGIYAVDSTGTSGDYTISLV